MGAFPFPGNGHAPLDVEKECFPQLLAVTGNINAGLALLLHDPPGCSFAFADKLRFIDFLLSHVRVEFDEACRTRQAAACVVNTFVGNGRPPVCFSTQLAWWYGAATCWRALYIFFRKSEPERIQIMAKKTPRNGASTGKAPR